jgi:hypothetical protein
MKDAVGIVIGRSSITAALVRGKTIAWTAERSVYVEAERERVVRELVATVPRKRGRRPALGVVVQSPLAQVRKLEGIPSLGDHLTARLVRENASSFFLKREGGIVVTSVHRTSDALWGAALDAEVVHGIVDIASSMRFDLRGVAATSEFVDTDAVAAAALSRRSPLVWTGEPLVRVRRRFRILASLALGVAIIASGVPILHSTLEQRRMRRELLAASVVEAEARSALQELRRLSRSLDERATFDASRGRVVQLLSVVAAALPESTAMLSLRVDSLEVNLVALSPRVTDVLPALGAVSQSVRLVGPVSHDALDGNRFERATFRLSHARQHLR